ncbi:MAG: hypothetical protein IKO40_14580 [Kiritimatiellae bacterium]|nr:hypothetical protein [Kiritimatiellia bacterium]
MKNAIILSILLLAIPLRADVRASFAGRLVIDSPVRLALEAKGALAPWRTMTTSGTTERADGTREFAMAAGNAPKISGEFRAWNDAAGGRIPEDGAPGGRALPVGADLRAARIVTAEWAFTPEADTRMEMFGLMGDLRVSNYGGGTLVADGEAIVLPTAGKAQDIRREGLTRLELADKAGGRRLAFAFREPVDLFLQYWGDRTMSLRLILPPDDRAKLLYRGGVSRRLAFSLEGSGDFRKAVLSPVEVAAGPGWVPLDARGEIEAGSALDFSALRPTGKPAGKFGRVVARGPHFEFEGMPGVPQRFYGVNLCSWVNYPKTPEDARKLARTLARVGYNSVRIHHHDGVCIDKSDPARVRLDEAMMRRMDAFVAACIEEGLYITTDFFVSRNTAGIPWRACGVDRDGDISMADYKHAVYVHEGVYSNFLAFAENWLCRTNTVTGRRYADEPAIAWISLVNEANPDFSSSAARLAVPGWKEAWETWLAGKKAAEPERFADVTTTIPNGLNRDRQGRAFLLFLQDVEARFIGRTRDFMQSLGYRALVSDMNDGWGCTAALMKERADSCDYVDVHSYVDHPRFLEIPWRRPSWCPNENPFKDEGLGASPVSVVRVFDRPFTISEYDFCGPGRFRGVGGIAVGAEAALQDWAGLWRFAWSHDLGGAIDPGTRTAGYFDIAADPLQLASERASLCLFLRGDAEPLTNSYAVSMPRERLSSLDAPIGMGTAMLDWVWAAWNAQIGCAIGNGNAGDFGEVLAKSSDEVRRDLGFAPGAEVGTGAVKIDPAQGAFTVATPRTCGIFAESGVFEAGALKVESSTGGNPVAATVWASSLDGLPLAESRRILVTHLTDVQNTGARYADEAMTVLLDWGRLPHLMRAGKAKIELRIGNDHQSSLSTNDTKINVNPAAKDFALSAALREEPPFRVFALSPTGARLRAVPSSFDAATGILRFTADTAADPASATYLYEIVRE